MINAERCYLVWPPRFCRCDSWTAFSVRYVPLDDWSNWNDLRIKTDTHKNKKNASVPAVSLWGQHVPVALLPHPDQVPGHRQHPVRPDPAGLPQADREDHEEGVWGQSRPPRQGALITGVGVSVPTTQETLNCGLCVVPASPETELLFRFVCNTKRFPGMVSKVSWLWWNVEGKKKENVRTVWGHLPERKAGKWNKRLREFILYGELFFVVFFWSSSSSQVWLLRKICVSTERLIRAFLRLSPGTT